MVLNEVRSKPVIQWYRQVSYQEDGGSYQNPTACTKKMKNEVRAIPSPVEIPFFTPTFLASFKRALYLKTITEL